MRLLLDTHVVIWWLADDPTLSDDVKSLLDEEPDVFLSAATVWEIAIKQALGKLVEPPDLADIVVAVGFRALPMTSAHAIAAARLPAIHRDPFDRMLVAQARSEDLTLLTRDAAIQKYDVTVVPV
jgi:PIN domain nuclease of toxin-antitoxin system